MDKIAIIGMGCLFPDYSNREKFWHTIIGGGNFLRQDKFLDKTIERGGISFSGTKFFSEYFSSEEYDEFETYGELYKWCAYIIDESLRDANYMDNPSKLKGTGLIMGTVGQTTCDQIDFLGPFVTKNLEREINRMVGGDQFKYTFTPQIENLKPESILADTYPIQYLAKKRGIGGPVLSFNAACASPLYALRLATSYLNRGEVDMVIAGSQCYNETIGGIFGLFSKFGILCDIGESMPLDKGSKGLIPGSGAGLFVLKRLEDAQRDKDKILGVIESIGWSNDGDTSSGIMTPSTKGQIKAFESAYENGISTEIDYIECHATGTEAGDKVEIESIESFFGYDYLKGAKKVPGRPLLGGLKGSTGHFFTATACASIVKVILAMEHEMIPATPAVTNPLCEGLVLENTPWKAGEKLRRAGINAFGFGGINAHLVLSEYRALEKDEVKPRKKRSVARKTELAITGMGFRIGGFESVEEFLEGLMKDKSAFTTPDENRFRGYDKEQHHLLSHGFEQLPKGSYISRFRFDAMKFKMPITGNPFFLRRDMLLLETVAEALDYAGIKKGEAPRTAVIAHSAPDYSDPIFMATYEIDESIRRSLKESYPELTQEQRDEILNIMREDEAKREHVDNVPGMIGNIRGNRISAHWGFFGPSFTLLENETSIFRGLELAGFFLSEGIVDQVVIAVSSLSGEFEHLYAQKELGVMNVMEEHGIAEGAVAFVLKSKKAAMKDKDHIYAIVDGVSLSSASKEMSSEVDNVLKRVFKQGKPGKGRIQSIEIPTSYSPEHRSLIEKICKENYQEYLNQQVKLLNVERYLGFGFSLSAAASLVRHGLQLYLSCIFNPDSNGKQQGFKKVQESEEMVSLVTGYTLHGNFGAALLSQHQSTLESVKDKRLSSRLIPLPLPFDSKESLLENLQGLEEATTKKSTLKQLYHQFWENYENHRSLKATQSGRGVVVLCDSKETLQQELVKLREMVKEDSEFLDLTKESAVLPIGRFFEEESTEASIDFFRDKFGLPPELTKELNLGESLALYQPANYLLKLGARIMFEGIAFDYKRFFGNFDFYILKQPSYIREISTGMEEFSKRIASPENRRILATIRDQLGRNSRKSLSPMAIPVLHPLGERLPVVNLVDFYENKLSLKPELRLIHEVVSVDHTPCLEGLGSLVVKSRMKDSPPIIEEKSQKEAILSKALLDEGVNQAQALYAMTRGYLEDEVYSLETNEGTSVFIEEEIPLLEKTLQYELKIKSIVWKTGSIKILSDCEVYWQGTCIYKVEDKCLLLKYKSCTA